MNKNIIYIGIVFGFLCIFLCGNLSAGNVQLNYKGEWYSGGFGDFSAWKNFVTFFINTMLDVKIVETDGKIGLVTKDPYGNEHINTELVSFDKNTGALNFLMDVPLPGGKIEGVSYRISFNGDYNISKYIDYTQFLNKTIKDLLIYSGKQHLKIGFNGNYSNVTIVPSESFSESNPSFNVTYEKNTDGDYTSPIISENNSSSFSTLSENEVKSQENSTKNLTETENLTENSYEGSNSLVNKSKKEDPEFKIINPVPNNTKIYMNVGQKKIFSIENVNYDTVKWSLNGKIVKERSNFYEFYANSSGKYNLNVQIERELINKTHSWSIEIYSEDKTNYEFIKKVIIIAILIILLAIILLILSYFLKSKK